MINVRRLSPRERRAAILTAAVLLGGLLWDKVLEPTVNRWLQLRREIVASEKELMKMQELLVQKDAVITKLCGINGILDGASHRLVC